MTIIEDTRLSSPELDEINGKIKDRRKQIHDIMEQAGPARDMSLVKSIDGDSHAKVAHLQALNTELDELGQKRSEELTTLKAAQYAMAYGDDGGAEAGDIAAEYKSGRKTPGDLFADAGAFKHRGTGATKTSMPDFDVKTLFSTTAGWAPESVRGPRLVDIVQQRITILDLIPTTTTGQPLVKYMEETTYTNNAAEVAEGGSKPEGALALTEQSSNVRKIAVWIPVTDEQLEDEPRVRGYLNNRLPLMVRQRLAGQVLVGDGSAPNLRGLLNVVGIQTQAKGADPVPDAVYKAMVKVMTTGDAMPDGVVFNPLDWQDVRLLRTADGIYIWGNPSEAGPERIWGLNVALEQRLTQNTAVVGDFGTFSELAIRKGIEVTTGWVNDDFIKNRQVILAEMRAAFVVYRPAAFCTVTGV